MRILQIINSAYRATVEEQDDTVVWLTHAMALAGGDFDVLLCGAAVNYAIQNEPGPAVTVGAWQQTCPPDLSRDIAGLLTSGVAVRFVVEDFNTLGLDLGRCIDGLSPIARSDIANLLSRYDRVLRW